MQADFIPSDDLYPVFTLNDLIKAIEDKYGENCDKSNINILTTTRQFKCFGYDLYDPSDYRIEFDFTN